MGAAILAFLQGVPILGKLILRFSEKPSPQEVIEEKQGGVVEDFQSIKRTGRVKNYRKKRLD